MTANRAAKNSQANERNIALIKKDVAEFGAAVGFAFLNHQAKKFFQEELPDLSVEEVAEALPTVYPSCRGDSCSSTSSSDSTDSNDPDDGLED